MKNNEWSGYDAVKKYTYIHIVLSMFKYLISVKIRKIYVLIYNTWVDIYKPWDSVWNFPLSSDHGNLVLVKNAVAICVRKK